MKKWIDSAQYYSRIVHGVHRISGRPFHQIIFRLAAFRLRHSGNPQFFAAAGLVDLQPSSYGDYIDDADAVRMEQRVALPQWRHLEENKLAFAARCAETRLPTGEILGAIVTDASEVTAWEGPTARSPAQLDDMLRRIGDADVIIKLVFGGLGYGVHGATIRAGIPEVDGQRLDAVALHSWLSAQSRTPSIWMLQRRLGPHEELRELMPGPGLGTVRIHSFIRPDTSVDIRWAHLKIPGAGQITDNFEDGGRSTVIAAIDIASGRLRNCVGRTAPGDMLRLCDAHPVTGARVSGLQLPHWAALLNLIRTAALAFPELPALGWDVALTPSGPTIIEANWQFGATGIQVAQRTGIRRELARLLAGAATPRA